MPGELSVQGDLGPHASGQHEYGGGQERTGHRWDAQVVQPPSTAVCTRWSEARVQEPVPASRLSGVPLVGTSSRMFNASQHKAAACTGGGDAPDADIGGGPAGGSPGSGRHVLSHRRGQEGALPLRGELWWETDLPACPAEGPACRRPGDAFQRIPMHAP